MRLQRLLRPVVLALAVASVGCDSKSAEQRDLERQRDSLISQREALQMQQASLQVAALQVVATNPPDANARLVTLFQMRTLTDSQLSLVDSRLTDIQYRLGELNNQSY